MYSGKNRNKWNVKKDERALKIRFKKRDSIEQKI
jgi:hypothetical protein